MLDVEYKPLVSVVMITYGHEQFIEQAIYSVLIQECNFEIELIIANDKSPDKTDYLIENIISTHPKGNLIRYFSHNQNMGIMPNFIFALTKSRGKYTAICEGDDYWINKLKLQNQVDFLERNAGYSMICHNAFRIKFHYKNKASTKLFTPIYYDQDLSVKQILEKWIIPTASIVFRTHFIKILPKWYGDIYSGDLSLTLLLCFYGKVRFMAETNSVYRVVYTGTSASALYRRDGNLVFSQQKLLFENFNKETQFKYENIIVPKILKLENELKFFQLKEKGIWIVMFKMPRTFIRKIVNKIVNKIGI